MTWLDRLDQVTVTELLWEVELTIAIEIVGIVLQAGKALKAMQMN